RGALPGAAGAADDRRPAAPRMPGTSTDHDPQSLVGSWQVMGPPGIEGREVRLHAGGRVSLREGACVLGGGWSATDAGLMIMSINAATNECRDLDDAFEYFKGVQRYALMAGSVRLSDLSGGTVAVLTAGTPPADPDETFAPRDAAPDLPVGVQVPSLEVLTAVRWIPVETVGSDRWPDAKRPHAQFDVDGTWHGSDGCNGVGAPWSLDLTTGEWLAGVGGQTEIFCDNVVVSAMVGPARAVGIDGDELVFYGADGAETGRFVADEG
ncbi:MAG: META domain-containing protein, partial [Actinomycetia bacterium]|nr:META domain-containing protein [Actinomycetes bacterium]